MLEYKNTPASRRRHVTVDRMLLIHSSCCVGLDHGDRKLNIQKSLVQRFGSTKFQKHIIIEDSFALFFQVSRLSVYLESYLWCSNPLFPKLQKGPFRKCCRAFIRHGMEM